MITVRNLICIVVLTLSWGMPSVTLAGTEPFIGEIMITGANFCPRGWAELDGQLLPINQNQALFSLMGTMYGGDGRVTFALPDLRGRVPLHLGQGPGLANKHQGTRGGEESHALTVNEMPQHQHAILGSTANGNSEVPTNNLLGTQKKKDQMYVPAGAGALTPLHGSSMGPAGNSQPHNNLPPFLTLRYCIALQGIFPSRQ